MSLAVLADHMASKGRNGDTMLVHMAPEEVAGLHALALSHGGYMTINPQTGLPEAFSLKGLLKSALPMIAGFALGPAGFGIVSSALGAGALVGGATALATGSLQKGLMAGLGAYGGASLGSALVGGSSAGASAAAAEAAAQEAAKITAANDLASAMGTEYVSQEATSKALQEAASKAYSNFAAKPLLEQATGSFTALKDAPGMFGGLGALARPALMAAAPIIADQAVQTATSMPTGQRYQGTIRPYKFDPYTKRWTAQPTYPATPVNTAPEPAPAPEQQPPGGYNTGGIVALAAGGVPNIKEFMDKSGADFQTASDLIYGVRGSNQDTRNWNAIMAAQDPITAARQATNAMYGGVKLGEYSDPEGKFTAPMLYGANNLKLTGQVDRAQNFGLGLTGGEQYLMAPSAEPALVSSAPQRTGSVAEQNVLNTKNWQSRSGLTGIEGLNSNINMWFQDFPKAGESDIRSAMQQYGLNDADIMRATGKSVSDLAYKPPVVQTPAPTPAPITPGPSTPGTQGPSATFGGDTVIPEYTAPVTTPTLGEAFQPTPQTMEQVRTNYEQGGGSTAMPTVTTLRPGERPMTQNAVVDKLQAYLDANPNATAGEIMTWGRNNAVPEYQLRAAVNERRFSTMTGGTKNAYDYLMGRGQYPTTPFVPGGGALMRPYSEVVGGTESAMRRFRPTMPPSSGERGSTTSTTQTTKTTTPSVDTLRTSFDQSIFSKSPEEKAAYYNSLLGQGYTDEQIRAAINAPLDDNWLALRAIAERLRAGTTGSTTGSATKTTGGGAVTSGTTDTTGETRSTAGGTTLTSSGVNTLLGNAGTGSTSTTSNTSTSTTPITDFLFGTQDADTVPVEDRSTYSNAAVDERINNFLSDLDRSFYYDYAAPSRSFDDTSPFARGGLADVAAMSAARGGNVQGYNLGGYSDGGRLLRGPGDGVSDSIPATIGNKQPARLADGEFVIPARIVSEIGNGSTEAGARKLYKMMDRVQRARAKTTGKGKVAKNTRAEKYLPA